KELSHRWRRQAMQTWGTVHKKSNVDEAAANGWLQRLVRSGSQKQDRGRTENLWGKASDTYGCSLAQLHVDALSELVASDNRDNHERVAEPQVTGGRGL